MRLIFATGNSRKVDEANAFFADSGVTVVGAKSAGINTGIDEAGTTLEANALLKARYAHKQAGYAWVFADDTGIFINALAGEPGVRTARWAGSSSAGGAARYCLEQMRGKEDRRATFRTVIVLIEPKGAEHVFTGEVDGDIAERLVEVPLPSMPYGSLFIPKGDTRTLQQMSIEEENAISHRGKAFREMRAWLAHLLLEVKP